MKSSTKNPASTIIDKTKSALMRIILIFGELFKKNKLFLKNFSNLLSFNLISHMKLRKKLEDQEEVKKSSVSS